MRRPPSLRLLPRYPVTGGFGVLALATTLMWWSGRDVTPLIVGPQISQGELWRLLTSVFPHVDLIHLLFNLYWLWVFGTVIESAWGSFRTLCIFIVFAAGSSAAEFAVGAGGVGLSGVGYGLFGLLWVMTRNDRRFYLVVDRQTTMLFIAWFFICILLTAAGVWRVGNIAHGAGAVLGLLLGNAIAHPRHERRPAFAAGVVVLLALAGAGATVARPYINRSEAAAQELGYWGFEAIENNDCERAIAFCRRAVTMDPRQADCWHNLGVAHSRLGQYEEALSAFQRAATLEPGQAGHLDGVGYACAKLGRIQKARHAYARAAQLLPDKEINVDELVDRTAPTPRGHQGADDSEPE